MSETWSFAPGHVPSWPALLLLGLCAAIALVEATLSFTRRGRAMPRRTAIAVLLLRLLAVLALFAIAFELTLRFDRVAPTSRRVVVLVDRSASMAIPDASEGGTATARIERLRATWAAAADARASWRDEGLRLDVRAFAHELEVLGGEAAESLAVVPDGAASDLAAALASLGDDRARPGERLAAVVVLSDGLVGANDDAASAQLQEVGARLGVPITTVSVGAPALRDVAVSEVRAGEFAFVENVAAFEATVVAHGLRGERATVTLRRNGETVGERRLALSGDGVPQRVEFEVAPDRVGQFVYEILVTELPGEATVANNRRAFVVKVLRDKVRVLHVAGRPDWDVRALRTLLRRDPNVELLSYYILRDFDDIAREDSEALSLIPFPTEELFEQELGSFDLVVLHNFDAVKHSVGQYVDNMAQFVEDGGALVLIGGDLGFSDRGYGSPEMAQQLPIDLRRRITHEPDRVRPKLTDAGRRHPITGWLLAGDGLGWSELPELEGWNPVELRDADDIGATTLLAHPTQLDGRGQPRPILAVSEPGKGRVVVLATGSTWRLGFAPELALVDGARPYDLLWLGVVRWLLRDDSSGRLQLDTDAPRYRVDQPVELRARTLTAAYAPEAKVPLRWQVEALRDVGEGASDEAAEAIASGSWTTDDLGRAQEQVTGLPIGAYKAIARREGDGEAGPDTATAVERVFIVEAPGRELGRIDADAGIARLEGLATATGGTFVDAAQGAALPAELPTATTDDTGGRVTARRELALWGGPGALLLLLVAFGGEWWLRRRAGAS
ncbi:MAG: hypothetical protein IPK74_22960 [Deltaproteobacteria bacterium]|nr:hypothetical protein [Deltaproteobacteria bacterium]